MICRYCGNVVDDNAELCPHCGSEMTGYEEPVDFDLPQVSYEPEYSYEELSGGEEVYEDTEVSYARGKKKLNVKLPNVPLSTLISLASAIFSFICLMGIFSAKAGFNDGLKLVNGSVSQLQGAIIAMEDRLVSMETTIANVQNDAYNQLASQNITITKDITSLVGPVTLGKYNQMFIVKAKGNLSLNTSFDWQKYNEATNGWVSIVFTGTATSNDEYGLRLENKMEEGEYVSILWANGITPSGAGTYRCVISDTAGVKKTSSEAIVQVA